MSDYSDLAKFINKADERRFNDTLISVLVLEIKLKTGEINPQMILPRYHSEHIIYNGEYHAFHGKIGDVMPKKALRQIQQLAQKGASLDFAKHTDILEWLHNETGITRCSLNAACENPQA